MPHYKIRTPNGRIVEIDAPNEDAAIEGAKLYVRRYPNPDTAPRPGSGPRLRNRPEPPARRRYQTSGPVANVAAGVYDTVGGTLDTMLGHIVPGAQNWGVSSIIRDAIGADVQINGRGDRWARSAGQLLPSALAPGSALGRTANVVVPLVGGEVSAGLAEAAGGDAGAQDTARFWGQLAGAGAAAPRVGVRPGRPAEPPMRPRARPEPVRNTMGEPVKPSVSAKARARINRAITDDESGGHTSRAQVAERLRSGERPYAAGGPNLQALAEDAAQQPGPGMARLELSAGNAVREAGNDLRVATETALGGRGDYFATQDAALQAQRTAAREGMAAFGQDTFSPSQDTLISLRSSRARAAIADEAENLLASPNPETRNVGAALNRLPADLLDNPAAVQMNVQTAQNVSFTLRQAASAAFRAGDGSRGRVLQDMANALRNDARKSSRSYSDWLTRYGDDADNNAMLERGRNIFSNDRSGASEQIARELQDAGPAAREYYRKGVGEAVLAQLNSAKGDVGTVRSILNSREVQARLRLAFPDDASMAEFLTQAERVASRQRIANRILHNSATARRLALRAEGQAPDPSGYVGDALTLDVRNAANRAVGDITRNVIGGMDWGDARAVRDLIGQAMDDPALFDRLLADAEKSPLVSREDLARLRAFASRFRPEVAAPNAAVGVLAARTDSERR